MKHDPTIEYPRIIEMHQDQELKRQQALARKRKPQKTVADLPLFDRQPALVPRCDDKGAHAPGCECDGGEFKP